MHLPPSVKNWLSLAGAMIALVSFFLILFFLVITLLLHQSAVYLGLLTYILLPGVMIAGLILIPLGMWVKIAKERRGEKVEPGWPRIDLNDPRYRNAFFIFVFGTGILVLFSAVGSYEAFQYTESVHFCGKLCHKVMQPEFTAHEHSSHSRVTCVACHVGPGAGWYVRSKMSGLYQVYAVVANVYPRPIPTPIENLRPAREVCEECHWPEKFYGRRLFMESHYLSDRNNTRWDIRLVMKLGSQQAPLGFAEGIHWHINPGVRIEYAAADKGRQEISWVRVTNSETGTVKLFKRRGAAASSRTDGQVRVMDCIDCHNRPSHRYRAPSDFVDAAMTAGVIPRDLPEVKRLAVDLCSAQYPTQEAALLGISEGMLKFYREKYPMASAPLVDKGVKGLQTEFSRNIFPEMKVRWSAYPDNIGHLSFKGCFRCHDGTHVAANGEIISKDCNLCHLIDMQGTPGKNLESAMTGEGLVFRHPIDIGTAWKESPCSDCHTGANP